MNRESVIEHVLEAKVARGLGYAEIADRLGAPKVWTAAALHGQHPFTPTQAATLREALGLPDACDAWLTQVPVRGVGGAGRAGDPTIYRLQEVVDVYGVALKALIHEEFGDGIMSAINFHLELERHEVDGEDRVRIVLDGKFLPYKW